MTHDHQSRSAADGTEALAVLRGETFDLAIIDRNMPGISGIDVVKIIRLNPKISRMKILMCTSSSVNKEVDEAFESGANDYILKPLNFAALLGKVAKVLTA